MVHISVNGIISKNHILFKESYIQRWLSVQLFRTIQAVGYLDRVANRGEYLDNFSKNQGWIFGQILKEHPGLDIFSEQQMGCFIIYV